MTSSTAIPAEYVTISTAAELLDESPWDTYKLASNDELGTPLRALDGIGPILVRRVEVEALRDARAEVDGAAGR